MFHLLLIQLTMIHANEIHQLDRTVIIGNHTDGCYNRKYTLPEIKYLLKLHPCVSMSIENGKNVRRKRDTEAGTLDIHSLYTTVNDHRSMINYLINNSINATFVSDAITQYHSRTGPIFTSWRDMTDMFCIIGLIVLLVYILICRAGLNPCKPCLSIHSNYLARHTQQQQQYLEQQLQEQKVILQQLQETLNKQEKQHTDAHSIRSQSIRRGKSQCISMDSASDGRIRSGTGYASD